MIPNCVQEYYRELEEEQDRLYAQQMERQFQYQKNRELLDYASAGGLYVLAEMNCANECFECTNRTPCIQRDEEDDIGLFVCLNKRFCIHQDEGRE